MIDFFFRKKEVTVDFFTDVAGVYNMAKPTQSAKILPQWFKNMPKSYDAHDEFVGSYKLPTMKSCPGIIDYYKNSVVLPVWSDFILNVTPENYGYLFSNRGFDVDEHSNKQTHNAFDEYHHAKFISPWKIRCKSDIDFLIVEPFWNSCTNTNRFENFHIFSGCVNFKYISHLNINVLIKKTNARVEFSLGEPFVNIFPLTNKKIKIATHLVDSQELDILAPSPAFTFFHRYKTTRRLLGND